MSKKNLIQPVEPALNNNRLKEAFNLTKENLQLLVDSKCSSEASAINQLKLRLNNAEDTYTYMLKYMVKGLVDENRDGIVSDIKSSLLRINDIISKELKQVDSNYIYFSLKRLSNLQGVTLQNLFEEYDKACEDLEKALESDKKELLKKKEKALNNIFTYLFTSFGAHESDYEFLRNKVKEIKYDENFYCQVISALLLGNLYYFDSKSIDILFDIYDLALSSKIEARAMTAIFLILSQYPDRVIHESKILSRLAEWERSPETFNRIKDVLINIIRTKETVRISEKVENEIMPELLKHKSELLDKFMKASQQSEIEGDDFNPDWEEMIGDTGLQDKLQELTELQMEGGDFMMLAFKNLKDFPFFRDLANWLLPFSFENSYFCGEEEMIPESLQKLFSLEGVICNSDKYSFALSLLRMPKAQREMLSSQLSAQMEQIKEAESGIERTPDSSSFNSEVLVYVRDLYRFFKLFPKRNEFSDPFESSPEFFNFPFLKSILSNPEIIGLAGDFYIKKNYYQDALSALQALDKLSDSDNTLWEKIGYSFSKLGNYEEALKWYRKADLLNPNGKWLKKRMAYALKVTGNYEEAYEAYKVISEWEPENLNVIINMGLCKMQQKRWDQAIPHFYHANYQHPENIDIWRWIAWCEMLAGQLEKSEKFYEKLANSGLAEADDFLNIGHLKFFEGKFDETVDNFKKVISLNYGNSSALSEAVEKDLQILQKKGMKKEDIMLLVDLSDYEYSAKR